MSNIMLVFYQISNREYFFSCDLDSAVVSESDGKLYLVSNTVNVSGIDPNQVAYAAYRKKEIIPEFEIDPESGMEYPVAKTIDELGLELIEPNDLPKSQHIAKLKAVNPLVARPATVTRRFLGDLYDVDCFVTQGVKDEYAAGDIQIGDYVIVSYTRTGDDNETLPIVTGKVFKSW